jgi:hypothetical protein
LNFIHSGNWREEASQERPWKGATMEEQRNGGKGYGSRNSLHFLKFVVYAVRIVSKLPLDAIIDLMNPCYISFSIDAIDEFMLHFLSGS